MQIAVFDRIKSLLIVSPLLGLLVGCAEINAYFLALTQGKPAVYPERVVNNFVTACTAGRGKDIEEICVCTVRKLQTQYPLKTLVQIERQLRSGSLVSNAILQTLETCKESDQRKLSSRPGQPGHARPHRQEKPVQSSHD